MATAKSAGHTRRPFSIRLILMVMPVLMSATMLLDSAGAQKTTSKSDRLFEPAPRTQKIDYDKLTVEATGLLSQEIRINTTNPPGDELQAAKLLKEKFLADGIPATVWEPAPGRGVVAARLHGAGRHSAALVLLSHLDVVPANDKEWQVPPFSGEVKDGVIWGRGSIDDKGPGIIELMAMLAIKRSGVLLNRDIIFIATGDEEEGGRTGAGWLVTHQPGVFADARYLLNEGGGISARPNGKRYFAVSITEKTPLWLRLTAQGPEGHGAAPPNQTSVTELLSALNHIVAYRSPIRILDPVEDYFRDMGELDGGPPQFLHLKYAMRDDPAFVKTFVTIPRQNALVRDTYTPTTLEGSPKTNVIPATATATIDGRLLPGDNPEQDVVTIHKVINDDKVRVDVLLNFPAISSPRKSVLMTAIDDLAERENVPVVPMMIAGFTDSHYFRQKGLIAYGFIPIELTPAEEKGVHGINEHLPVKQLGAGIRRMVELLKTIGGH